MFPDIANVLRIREALWRHKALGSASIMVGAGFSRNADPVSTTARSMPAWSQMAQALCSPLYPHDDDRRKSALQEASGTSGFLRIAQEYQTAFGVSDLNDRIRNLVPDMDYRPGDLHKRLLRLPWADVFSTNWDTLLERTCADVFERSYDVVRTVGEIPFTARPRIVKLHGSFPGHDPFVFTEEDYRTYPRAFSPFVNLVQQAMMETIFCLVGFSGDDPNFLHWSGWVRDNLGPSAPKIYLVGWLELSNHRRRMLESRSVMPIDLSALPQATNWPEHLRHRYATEWFIAALELGKPYDFAIWPSPPTKPPSPPPYLRLLPARQGAEVLPEPWHRDPIRRGVDQLNEFRELIRSWRHNRRLYPGWIVAPESVRERLWHSTKDWIGSFPNPDGLASWERVIALGELAWRMEHALLPLLSNDEQSVRDALNAIDLRQRRVGDEPIPHEASWADILEAADRLARALARNGRRELDQAKFALAAEFLDRLSEHTPEARNTVTYERCLWDLATGNLPSLAERLDAWLPGEGDNLWNLRRAGLLAEMEEYGRASTLLENTLQRVRRNRRRDVDDFASLSLEGWALYLALPFVDRGLLRRTTFTEDAPEPFERWRELAVLDCDAFSEWSTLRRSVERGIPRRPAVERVRGFDLDHSSITRRYGHGPSEALLAAYRVVMLAEITGIPPSAQNMELFERGLKEAARVLADAEPALACQIAIRLGTTREPLGAVFSRAQVARLDAPLVQTLKAAVLNRLSFFISLIGSPSRDRANLVSDIAASFEVLSRLAVRLPVEDLQELFSKTLEHYRQVEVRRRSPLLGEALGNLLGRILESLPREAVGPLLPDLFGLPLPSENGGFSDIDRMGDPVSHLPEKFEPILIEDPRDNVWDRIVEKLLAAAVTPLEVDRGATIYRLFKLYQWGFLTEPETEAFAKALWDPAHRDAFGLPSHTNLLQWVLLLLPKEHPHQAEAALKQYIVEQSKKSDENVYSRSYAVGEVLRAFERESRALELSDSDCQALKELVIEWMDQHPPSRTAAEDPFHREDSYEAVATDGVAAILRQVSLDESNIARLWAKAENMDNGREGRCLAAPLYPYLAVAYPARRAELVDRLRRALVSDDEEIAQQAVLGSYRWLQFAPDPGLNDVVREIGIAIAGRRVAVLPTALEFAGWLFKQGPNNYRDLIAGDCEHGLNALLEEAGYHRTGQAFDVPKVRAAAFALADAMNLAGYGDRPGVRDWLSAAAKDPLPEVRNAAPPEVLLEEG